MPRSCTVCAYPEAFENTAAFWGHAMKTRDTWCADCVGMVARLLDRYHRAEQAEAMEVVRLLGIGMELQERERQEWLASAVSRRRAAQSAIVRLKDAVIARDGYTCGICGGGVEAKDLSIDHIIPVSRGGSAELENLQVAHLICNIRKGAKVA